jgi:hypothetical protein
MKTEITVEQKSELNEKGQALLNAAYEFWKAHQKLSGPRAVVWLEDTSGHLVIFTRGEYRSAIMREIQPLVDETPLAPNM